MPKVEFSLPRDEYDGLMELGAQLGLSPGLYSKLLVRYAMGTIIPAHLIEFMRDDIRERYKRKAPPIV